MAKWAELEHLIAGIHARLASDAVVEHDVRLPGKSGHSYQVDVLVKRLIGLYEAKVLIECKRHARPVGVGAVASFGTIIEDIGAARGVLVSASGFSKPAIALAERHSITLLSYQQADDADWHELTSPESRVYFVIVSIHFQQFEIITDPNEDRRLGAEENIVDQNGVVLGTVRALQKDVWRHLSDIRFLGPFQLNIRVPVGYHLGAGGAMLPISGIRAVGNKTARRYVTTPRVAGGHVLRSTRDQAMFQEIHLADIPWEELADAEQGVELTEEEYLKHDGSRSPDLAFTPILRDVDGQLRITLTKVVAENGAGRNGV